MTPSTALKESLASPPLSGASISSSVDPARPSSPGRPFTVNFDGKALTGTISITAARDIDRLVKVLQAQKAAFEAMEDEDEEDDETLG